MKTEISKIQNFSILRKYAKQLITNINKPETPTQIDIVLDGGAFKGGYLIGGLYLLKELENDDYIKINKISACSIGAIAALLYFNNSLELYEYYYNIIRTDFKQSGNLKSIAECMMHYNNGYMNKQLYNELTNKLFIVYFDTITNTQIVKSTYNSNMDVLDTITRATHLPLLSTGEIMYNNCIDGVFPYIFKNRAKTDSKILFLNLLRIGNLCEFLNTSNESIPSKRIFYGLLDTYKFFCLKAPTKMCSYVNDWSILDYTGFRIRQCFVLMVINIIVYLQKIKNIIPNYILCKISNNTLCAILKEYYNDLLILSCF